MCVELRWVGWLPLTLAASLASLVATAALEPAAVVVVVVVARRTLSASSSAAAPAPAPAPAPMAPISTVCMYGGGYQQQRVNAIMHAVVYLFVVVCGCVCHTHGWKHGVASFGLTTPCGACHDEHGAWPDACEGLSTEPTHRGSHTCQRHKALNVCCHVCVSTLSPTTTRQEGGRERRIWEGRVVCVLCVLLYMILAKITTSR